MSGGIPVGGASINITAREGGGKLVPESGSATALKLNIKDISIEAVPAYNTNKFRSPGVPFHPRESGYVGYILTVKGIRICHAGDTDVIPEMKSVHCDAAQLPVSGIYVMTSTNPGASIIPAIEHIYFKPYSSGDGSLLHTVFRRVPHISAIYLTAISASSSVGKPDGIRPRSAGYLLSR